MELRGIKDFLERYRKKLEYQDDLRSLVRSIIHECCDLSLTEKEFSIVDGTLLLRTNSVKKSHIYIHKRRIIEELKKKGVILEDIH